MRTRVHRAAALAVCLISSAAGLSGAAAHGSVSMDKDVCKLTAGPYVMHFTGYQPERTRAEFCEDIPATGHSVIVLDLLDDAVRDMTLQLKLVRAGDGPAATASAIFSTPLRTYPTGSVAIDYEFSAPGDYVGVVTLGSPPAYVAEFPFSVGKSRMPLHLAIGAVGLAGAGALAFYFGNKWRGRAIAAMMPGRSA